MIILREKNGRSVVINKNHIIYIIFETDDELKIYTTRFGEEIRVTKKNIRSYKSSIINVLTGIETHVVLEDCYIY